MERRLEGRVGIGIETIGPVAKLSRAGATDHCVTPLKEGPWFELSSRTRSCAYEPHTVTTRDTTSPLGAALPR